MSNNFNYKQLLHKDFELILMVNRQPAVLVFGADWSGGTEIMDSMMERISAEFNVGIHFFKVDVEAQSEISDYFNVHNIPTTIMIKDGEIKEMFKGFIAASKVRKKINDIFLSDSKTIN